MEVIGHLMQIGLNSVTEYHLGGIKYLGHLLDERFEGVDISGREKFTTSYGIMEQFNNAVELNDDCGNGTYVIYYMYLEDDVFYLKAAYFDINGKCKESQAGIDFAFGALSFYSEPISF